MPKRCAFVDEEGVRCGTRPQFNNPGETKGGYCNIHRIEGMVSITPFYISNADFYVVQTI
jgi:hypothetical protein